MFETWGNHDGPPAGAEKFGFSFQAQLKERNLRRQQKGWLDEPLRPTACITRGTGTTCISSCSAIYPADAQNPQLKRYSPVWHDPQGALSFLKEDLARHVGTSGRPVVLMSHCGFDTDWWHTNDWRALYDAAKPYNVVALPVRPHRHRPAPLGAAEVTSAAVRLHQHRPDGERLLRGPDSAATQLRLAYRLKTWREQRLPDRKLQITWDGTWEWKHVLRKPLLAESKALERP